jgi:hypothetical protein
MSPRITEALQNKGALQVAPATGALALALSLTLAVPASAQRTYTADRTLHADVSGVTRIRIENGSGRLVVNGKSGVSQVTTHATIRGSSQQVVNDVKITTEKNGDEIRVRADYPDHRWSSDNWSVDLTVEVPSNIKLDVNDGSGGAQLNNIGAATVSSGSGGVRVSDAGGPVDLNSGSGSVELRTVRGDVSAQSGSGSVEISDVTGSVDVRRAGSGNVTVSKVSGSVRAGSIGSGGLQVDNVGGDLTVERKGSGSIDYTGVKGKVSIPRDRDR